MAEFYAPRFAAMFAADPSLMFGRVLRPTRVISMRRPTPFWSIAANGICRHNIELRVGRKEPESSRLMPSVVWVRSFVPKLKNSASLAISSATRRGARNFDHRADQIIELRLLLFRHFARRRDARSRFGILAHCGNPTSGIMISGRTFMPFFCTSAAASKTARACISEISG